MGRRLRRLPGGRIPSPHGPNGTTSTATACGTGGSEVGVGELGWRMSGSADPPLVGRPQAVLPRSTSVTAHDGFTLRDLVTHQEKHNEANGEDNRDGNSHNRAWNPELKAKRMTHR